MKNKEWFRLRFYPHIGKPITNNDKKKVISYIKNKDKISKHSFLPFIHKIIKSRKLRKTYDINGKRLKNGKRTLLKTKKRDIYFANHLDANIYSYYSFLLNKRYNKVLDDLLLQDVITAYRAIPLKGEKRNKNNIDFAYEIFKYIKKSSQKKHTVAIAFDISSFFDNLDHTKLKEAWCKLFNWNKLPDDHYKIFRNITKFSFVEEKEIYHLFKKQIIVKSKTVIEKKKTIDKIKYLHNQNAIAYCEVKDIHYIRKKGLIRSNKRINGQLRNYGICQGSPISATLANIYLLEFDKKLNEEITKINGLYRRYSDDMVVVCDAHKKDFVIDLMTKSINNIANLDINKDKTQIFHFTKKNKKIICEKELNGKINKNSINWNFEYLGFSFNGENIYLKTSSLAKYYRKLKLNLKRTKYYSSTINNKTNGQIFKRRIYKRFSYIGSRRKRKYIRVKGTTDKWKRINKYNWGNYITYAKLAGNTMQSKKIKNQIKKHWKIINNSI